MSRLIPPGCSSNPTKAPFYTGIGVPPTPIRGTQAAAPGRTLRAAAGRTSSENGLPAVPAPRRMLHKKEPGLPLWRRRPCENGRRIRACPRDRSRPSRPGRCSLRPPSGLGGGGSAGKAKPANEPAPGVPGEVADPDQAERETDRGGLILPYRSCNSCRARGSGTPSAAAQCWA